MTIYGLISERDGSFVKWLQADDTWYAEQQAAGNPKAKWIRPQVVDAQPKVTAKQRIDEGPVVVEPTCVRVTWLVRDKPQAQIDFDARLAEHDALAADLAAWSDSASGTDIKRLKRLCKFLLEQVRLRGVG